MKTWKLCAIVGIFAMCAFGLVFMGCSDGGGGGGGEDSTPTAADFVIGNLSQVKESITAVTITPKSGKSRGAISVYYDGSATLPTKSGAYAVTFNVAAASGWKAANGLNAGTLIVNDIAVNSTDVLSTYLSDQTANTADTPYYIALNIGDENDFTNLRTTLNNEADKYVYLDLSGSTITTIPENTFSGTSSPYGCATLIGITIPNNVISIGDFAFMDCTSLTSVIIPNSVTSIGAGTFYGCTNLTKVTIPNSITSIGQNVFYACTNLASVTFEGTIPSSDFSTDSNSPFFGDLRDKFYATDPTNGTPGTYTTTAPVGESSVWIKQP